MGHKARDIVSYIVSNTVKLEDLRDYQRWVSDRIELLEKETRLESPIGRLEKCLLAIAANCDGAASDDSVGFNGCDANYGRRIARKITAGYKMDIVTVMRTAKMMQKYRKQVEHHSLLLPTADDIVAYLSTTEGQVADAPIIKSNYIEADLKHIMVYSTPQDKEVWKSMQYCRPVWDNAHNNRFKYWELAQTNDNVLRVIEEGTRLGYTITPDLFELHKEIVEAEKKLQVIATAEAQKLTTASNDMVAIAKLDEPLPSGRVLYQHQREAVSWMLGHTARKLRGAILADTMGLGKTSSALVVAKVYTEKHDCQVIIIAPKSLQQNWAIEAEMVGCKKVNIYTWGKIPEPFEKSKYVLIGDECHYCQSIKSARTKAFIKLAGHQNCMGVFPLTGTPMKNGRPSNLYPLLKIIGHPIAANKFKYEKKFCAGQHKIVSRAGKKVWDANGAANLVELRETVKDGMLQRTKEECLDLPERNIYTQRVNLENSDAVAYSQAIQEAIAAYEEAVEAGEKDEAAQAVVTLGIMRKIGSQYKASRAIELAEDVLDQGDQVVIFTEFTYAADEIAHHFNVLALTGDTKQSDRQRLVDEFQAGKTKVFVGTIKAGGVGITLTASQNIIVVDYPWTPGDLQQALDRVHRIGQKNAVTGIILELGKIDTLMANIIHSKQQNIDAVMSGMKVSKLPSINELALQIIRELKNP